EVVPAPVNAPRILGATLDDAVFDGQSVTYSGTIRFEDADGDIAFGGPSDSLVRLMAVTGTSIDYTTAFSASGMDGTFNDTKGQPAGEIAFRFRITYKSVAFRLSGRVLVAVTIMDSAGNQSNVATVTISNFIYGL